MTETGQFIVMCSVGALLGGFVLVMTAFRRRTHKPPYPPLPEVGRNPVGRILLGIMLIMLGGLGIFLMLAGRGLAELADH